jgi:hypothetical protein
MLAVVIALPQPHPRGRTRLLACAIVSTLLALLTSAPIAAAAGGLSGGNSFSELTKSEPEAPKTQTVSGQSSETGSTSNSKVLLLAGGLVAVALLGGIAFAIARDARRVAPAGDAQLTESRSRSDAAARVRRRRAQAKAARRHRKRNR